MDRVSADRREILWDRRHYLYEEPAALPRVLLAAHSWEWACLPDLHAMVAGWSQLPPVDAIQLLLPRSVTENCFCPDQMLRSLRAAAAQVR